MLRLALIYILVTSCTLLVTASRKEVAVIFGGLQENIVTNNDSSEEEDGDKEVKNINSPFLEFYSPSLDSCIYDGIFSMSSNIFSYTGPPIDNAGTYVDNQAIYVCGGAPASDSGNTTCSVFTGIGSWSNIFYAQDTPVQQMDKHLVRSAMLPWLGDSFIQVGGKNPGETGLDSLYDATYIFSPSQDDQDNILEDKSKRMLYPRAGHCFVKTRSEAGHDVYMVIGGEKVDPNDILYVHCIQEDCLDFEWFGANIEGLDGVSLEELTCTSFTDHEGEQAVLIVTTKATMVISQTCGNGEVQCTLRSCKMPCAWTVKSSTTGLGGTGSKVTTLDNTPFLFTQNIIYEYDSENTKWLVRQDSLMEYPRLHHTVVSVPEDWLCYVHFTTQTTTTTTTTSTTKSPASSTTDCPSGAKCEATDGRGILWTAEVNTLASKSCGEGMEDSEATWFCECSGQFRGPQPDRLQCVEKWIRDLDEAIADPSVTSDSIAEAVMEKIRASAEAGPGPTGGGLKRLVEVSGSLLNKRHQENLEAEEGEEEEGFTDNMVASVSVLVGLEVGWNEIAEDEVRFTSSSGMLALVDSLGFMFSQEMDTRRAGCERRENRFSQVDIDVIQVLLATSAGRPGLKPAQRVLYQNKKMALS